MSGKESDIQKRNQEIRRKLHSGRDDVILQTLIELRSKGNRDILPEVIDLVSADVSPEITDAGLALLNDLKHKGSAWIIPEAIRKDRHRKNLDRIVASCWQNGMDYSQDIDLFIDLVLEEDYVTAIEAFTVVEQNLQGLSAPQREQKAIYLENRFNDTRDDKRRLVRELIAVVKTFPGPVSPELN